MEIVKNPSTQQQIAVLIDLKLLECRNLCTIEESNWIEESKRITINRKGNTWTYYNIREWNFALAQTFFLSQACSFSSLRKVAHLRDLNAELKGQMRSDGIETAISLTSRPDVNMFKDIIQFKNEWDSDDTVSLHGSSQNIHGALAIVRLQFERSALLALKFEPSLL